MKKLPSLLILLNSISTGMFAVEMEDLRPDLPSTPQAEAFKRLGEFTVGNSSGMPNIGIPLFDIEYGGYTIPLGLHYEANPLKPGYNYDVYGYGWTMSGNSCVSRTIRDTPDEQIYFSGTNPFELDSFTKPNGDQKRYVDYHLSLRYLNFKYDDFTVTLPDGRSIPFYIHRNDSNLVYNTLPSDSNVKISCHYSTNVPGISDFTVVDEKGITYYFGVPESATNAFMGDNNAYWNSSWLLSSISIPNKGSINYSYSEIEQFACNTADEPSLNIFRKATGTESVTSDDGYHIESTSIPQAAYYKMKFLKEISYGPTTISVDYLSDKRHTKKITIKDTRTSGTVEIKSINFTMNTDATRCLSQLSIRGKRSDSNVVDSLVYKFEYTANSPGSFIDPWGNYGYSTSYGDIGNMNVCLEHQWINRNDISSYIVGFATLLPEESGTFWKMKLQSTSSSNERRASDPSGHLLLHKMIYPNGGYTTFTFENHRFPTATSANGDLEFNKRQQRIIQGGGFRIAQIVNYTAGGSIASMDDYKYGYTYEELATNHIPYPMPVSYDAKSHTGAGEAVVDPTLLTYLSYNHSYNIPSGLLKMFAGIHTNNAGSMDNWSVSGNSWWWNASFCAFQFRNLLGGRRAVVYPKITVYHTNESNTYIGKTVYEYDIYDYDVPASHNYLTGLVDQSRIDTMYFEPVHYINGYEGAKMTVDEYPEKRDHLVSVSEYSRPFTVNTGVYAQIQMSKEEYDYKTESITRTEYDYSTASSMEGDSVYWPLRDFYEQTRKKIGSSKKIKTTTTRKNSISLDSGIVEQNTFAYGNHIRTRNYQDRYPMVDSYVFSGDSLSPSSLALQTLNQNNRLATIIEAKTKSQNETIGGYKIDYATYIVGSMSMILPSVLYEYNGHEYKECVQVISYTNKGNPQEILDIKTGIRTTYIWGYSERYIVAEVVNATYANVWNRLRAYQSEIEDGYSLRIESLNSIRPYFSEATIKTWTYAPFKGVTAYTDPSGMTMKYEYDGLGRLLGDAQVVHGATNPLHKYQYNFVNH